MSSSVQIKSGYSQCSKMWQRKNVRHHDAESRGQTANFENEFEQHRIENDPSSPETEERRHPVDHNRTRTKNGR